jgi:hypothetical protein
MDIFRKWSTTLVAIAFTAGLVLGWLIIGWLIWPVEYAGARIPHLELPAQESILVSIAELYAIDGDATKVHRALDGWRGDFAVCHLAANIEEPELVDQLVDVAKVVNVRGCDGVSSGPGIVAAGPIRNLGMIISLSLALVILGGAILDVQRMRNALLTG